MDNNMATKMEQRLNENKRKTEQRNSSSHPKEQKKKKHVFVYGNYHRYYGYRFGQALDEDPRMKVFRKEWFEGKDCLDIGCNEGIITISIAQKFECRSILGVDIDDRLIGKARVHLKTVAGVEEGIERNEQSNEEKCRLNGLEDIDRKKQSYGDKDKVNGLKGADRKDQIHEDGQSEIGSQVTGRRKMFCQDEKRVNKLAGSDKKSFRDKICISSSVSVSDYVEKNVKESLLERVRFRTQNFIENFHSELDATYDTVLCLSVTKWVHLNWGDTGLIHLFVKIWQVLRPGGLLVLEPQPWKSYERNHHVSEVVAENFQNIVYKPNVFRDILLDKIGFRSMENISAHIPNSTLGFDRPIYLLVK